MCAELRIFDFGKERTVERKIYRPLPECDMEKAMEILDRGVTEELLLLPLSVGEYFEYWKPAQDICVRLFEHKDAAVRANAALGLAYIARTKGALDKRIVKPYLLRELRENTQYRWRIVDAIQDINLFLGWKIAEKMMERYVGT